MVNRRLVAHFLGQFVDAEATADGDRHQVLALIAAGLVTLPLFITVFMSVKYLIQVSQTPAWTQLTALTDRSIFCSISMLVSAIVATIEWDALALSPRDSAILGVLPLSHRELLTAKVVALVTFAAAVILAINALPMLLHPPVMASNLAVGLPMAAPLIAARGLGTMAAGAFGFAAVVAFREFLYLAVGRRRFSQAADLARSALLLVLLLLLLTIPSRVPGADRWPLEAGGGPVLQRPVGWFVALDTVMTDWVLDDVPRPAMSVWEEAEDDRRVAIYRDGRRYLVRRAFIGAAALLLALAAAAAMYLWNARRLHMLAEGGRGASLLPVLAVAGAVATVVARRPAARAGLLFLLKTALGNPLHRSYLIAAAAIGVALWLPLAPAAAGGAATPDGPYELVAQTFLLTAIVAGFRAALRKSGDRRAAWLFAVADTGTTAAFRGGVRAGVLVVVLGTVLVLAPLHAAAWGNRLAVLHAINGAAIGWLLVEIACGDAERPLVRTMATSDALNTVGAVFLGAIVIGVFILAGFERRYLGGVVTSVLFAAAIAALAAKVRRIHERDHRDAAVLSSATIVT